MFWRNKSKISEPIDFKSDNKVKREALPFPQRRCWLYISSKYKEVIFVPMGKTNTGMSYELNSVVVKEWPLNIGELQQTIHETLDKWTKSIVEITPSKNNWHSFNASKAKTQQSFQIDYVQMSLTTDIEKGYEQCEVERIIVTASPKDWQKDNYKLINIAHLTETLVAQIVLDIFNACEKIRTN